MTYDYHGEWEMKTGANAPVSGDGLNLTTSIAAYKAAGVPKEKMVLGFATYARGWSGVDSPALGVPATGKGPDGPCGVGSLTAAQAQAWTKGGGYTEYWSEETKTPFAYSKAKKTLVSYDNARAYDAKLTLLKAEGLAGAMFWAIDLDDFQAGYPLIGQVSRSLGVAPAEPEQASPSPISPQKKP